MFSKKIVRAAAAFIAILALAGCGDDSNSNTNGTLTLTVTPSGAATDPAVGVTAKATLTSAREGISAVGYDVSFTAKQYGANASGVVITIPTDPACSSSVSTNSAGVAEWSCNFVKQEFATVVDITASAAGLAASKLGTPVPAFVVTPAP